MTEQEEKMAGKARSEESESWTLLDPDGNEFTTTSAVARYNLLAQGYTDKDADAAAKLTAKVEEKATDPAYARAADPTTYRSSRS